MLTVVVAKADPYTYVYYTLFFKPEQPISAVEP